MKTECETGSDGGIEVFVSLPSKLLNPNKADDEEQQQAPVLQVRTRSFDVKQESELRKEVPTSPSMPSLFPPPPPPPPGPPPAKRRIKAKVKSSFTTVSHNEDKAENAFPSEDVSSPKPNNNDDDLFSPNTSNSIFKAASPSPSKKLGYNQTSKELRDAAIGTYQSLIDLDEQQSEETHSSQSGAHQNEKSELPFDEKNKGTNDVTASSSQKQQSPGCKKNNSVEVMGYRAVVNGEVSTQVMANHIVSKVLKTIRPTGNEEMGGSGKKQSTNKSFGDVAGMVNDDSENQFGVEAPTLTSKKLQLSPNNKLHRNKKTLPSQSLKNKGLQIQCNDNVLKPFDLNSPRNQSPRISSPRVNVVMTSSPANATESMFAEIEENENKVQAAQEKLTKPESPMSEKQAPELKGGQDKKTKDKKKKKEKKKKNGFFKKIKSIGSLGRGKCNNKSTYCEIDEGEFDESSFVSNKKKKESKKMKEINYAVPNKLKPGQSYKSSSNSAEVVVNQKIISEQETKQTFVKAPPCMPILIFDEETFSTSPRFYASSDSTTSTLRDAVFKNDLHSMNMSYSNSTLKTAEDVKVLAEEKKEDNKEEDEGTCMEILPADDPNNFFSKEIEDTTPNLALKISKEAPSTNIMEEDAFSSPRFENVEICEEKNLCEETEGVTPHIVTPPMNLADEVSVLTDSTSVSGKKPVSSDPDGHKWLISEKYEKKESAKENKNSSSTVSSSDEHNVEPAPVSSQEDQMSLLPSSSNINEKDDMKDEDSDKENESTAENDHLGVASTELKRKDPPTQELHEQTTLPTPKQQSRADSGSPGKELSRADEFDGIKTKTLDPPTERAAKLSKVLPLSGKDSPQTETTEARETQPEEMKICESSSTVESEESLLNFSRELAWLSQMSKKSKVQGKGNEKEPKNTVEKTKEVPDLSNAPSDEEEASSAESRKKSYGKPNYSVLRKYNRKDLKSRLDLKAELDLKSETSRSTCSISERSVTTTSSAHSNSEKSLSTTATRNSVKTAPAGVVSDSSFSASPLKNTKIPVKKDKKNNGNDSNPTTIEKKDTNTNFAGRSANARHAAAWAKYKRTSALNSTKSSPNLATKATAASTETNTKKEAALSAHPSVGVKNDDVGLKKDVNEPAVANTTYSSSIYLNKHIRAKRAAARAAAKNTEKSGPSATAGDNSESKKKDIAAAPSPLKKSAENKAGGNNPSASSKSTSLQRAAHSRLNKRPQTHSSAYSTNDKTKSNLPGKSSASEPVLNKDIDGLRKNTTTYNAANNTKSYLPSKIKTLEPVLEKGSNVLGKSTTTYSHKALNTGSNLPGKSKTPEPVLNKGSNVMGKNAATFTPKEPSSLQRAALKQRSMLQKRAYGTSNQSQKLSSEQHSLQRASSPSISRGKQLSTAPSPSTIELTSIAQGKNATPNQASPYKSRVQTASSPSYSTTELTSMMKRRRAYNSTAQ